MTILPDTTFFDNVEGYTEAWDKCDHALSELSQLISHLECTVTLSQRSESFLARVKGSEETLREAMQLLNDDCEKFQ